MSWFPPEFWWNLTHEPFLSLSWRGQSQEGIGGWVWPRLQQQILMQRWLSHSPTFYRNESLQAQCLHHLKFVMWMSNPKQKEISIWVMGLKTYKLIEQIKSHVKNEALHKLLVVVNHYYHYLILALFPLVSVDFSCFFFYLESLHSKI